MRIENTAAAGLKNTASTPDTPGLSVVTGRPVPQQTQPLNENLKLNNEKTRLEEAINQANKVLEGSNRHFKYEVHEPTNAVIISVIDNETNEVLREIPARKLLDVVSSLMELAGLVFDERR